MPGIWEAPLTCFLTQLVQESDSGRRYWGPDLRTSKVAHLSIKMGTRTQVVGSSARLYGFQMDNDQSPLADVNAHTLRSMIRVPRVYRGSQIANKNFWPRCRRMDTAYGRKIIFVDGFVGCCHSNSWKVFSDALEPGLSLWLGYSLSGDRWVEHAWCMLGDRIVESTFARDIYFGAELTPEECEEFGRRQSRHKASARTSLSVATFINGERTFVECYAAAGYHDTIGREREPATGQVKEGLGR